MLVCSSYTYSTIEPFFFKKNSDVNRVNETWGAFSSFFSTTIGLPRMHFAPAHKNYRHIILLTVTYCLPMEFQII